MLRIVALAAGALVVATLLVSGVTLASRGGGGGGIGGTTGGTQVDLNVQSDPSGHDPFIWGSTNPPPHNITLRVVTQGSLISICHEGPSCFQSQDSPWVDVHGEFVSGNQFVATGMGTVAGFQNVTVQMQGTWDGTTLTGKYTMGANRELPGGEPIVYGVKPKVTPTPTRTRTPTPPQKLYSIIVIKQNADTFQPLPGWHINLYVGAGCQGTSTNALTTNSNGLLTNVGFTTRSWRVSSVVDSTPAPFLKALVMRRGR